MTPVRPPLSPGIFAFCQLFQRGDLPLLLKGSNNQPTDPFRVTYALYLIQPGVPDPLLIGCEDRTPVKAAVGEYYVSGRAGEGGQLGDWFVRWQYQVVEDGALVEVLFPFKVYDKAMFTTDPCSLGWGQ